MSGHQTANVKFVGGAQEQYDSFKDLATAALDMYSPNWKTRSYMFPPVYSYGRPEVSDQEIEDLKTKYKEQEGSTPGSKGNSSGSTSQKVDPLPDARKINFYAGLRVGDKAEHIVYDALESVSHLASISPMVIINNLDLNRIKRSDKIFQNQDELCGEFDFVIIGPKIGIVVIEVKNSNKSKAGSQLRSFDKVIDFLQNTNREYPTVSLPAAFLVRKLLIFISSSKSSAHKKPQIDLGNQHSEVNPKDMGRKPQEQEVSSAESESKSKSSTSQKVDSPSESVKNISNKVKVFDSLTNFRIWDHGDIKNRTCHISKPGFYTKFFDFFNETGYSISKEVYESFAPILVGLASFLTFKNSSSSVLKLDLLKISERAVLIVDSSRLRNNNPSAVAPITKLETVSDFSVVLMPTPDQQRALAEPSSNRQLIIGAPGTGKTIVLQQKALKMLQDGKKVLILTARSYMQEFKKLLEINCCDNKTNGYSIFDYWSEKTSFFEEIFVMGQHLSDTLVKENGANMDPILFIKNFVGSLGTKLLFITGTLLFDDFDGILIDDACDQANDDGEDWGDIDYNVFLRFGNLCAALSCMAAFEIMHPSKILWIALDLVLPPLGNCWIPKNMQARSVHAQLMNCLLSNSTNQNPEYPFAAVVLNQIMRHSENIFRFAYTTEVLSLLKLTPIMGHKIVGKVVTKLSPLAASLKKDKISETVWIEVKKLLDQIRNDEIPLNLVCILVGGEQLDGEILLDTIKAKYIEWITPKSRTTNIKAECEALQPNPYDQSGAAGVKVNTADFIFDNFCEPLFLDHWYNASSREWPIVIFCTITADKFTWKYGHAIQRYRAYSRATVKLYEISARYPSLNGATSMAQDAETLTLDITNTSPFTNRKPALERSNTIPFDFTRIPRGQISDTDTDTHIFVGIPNTDTDTDTDTDSDIDTATAKYFMNSHIEYPDMNPDRDTPIEWMQWIHHFWHCYHTDPNLFHTALDDMESDNSFYSLSDTWFPSVYDEN